MRRFVLILIALLTTLFSISPISAQGSIASVIDNRSELSTLKVFLDAAPDMRDLLEGSGSFTMFAPNNQAFANLASSLEIPLADLLRSPEIVTAILQYHIIEGAYNAQQVSDLSGQVVPTLLVGAFLGIRVNDNNVVSLNNVVEIVTADLRASNGRVHIINDVFLNRVIDNLVDDFDIASFITPNPTLPNAEETAEAFTATATEIVATPAFTATVPPVSIALFRVAHLAPNTESIDVYLNDTLIHSVRFGEITDFARLTTDIYSLRILASDSEENLVEESDVTLLNGDFKTLVVFGDETIESAVIDEDYSQLANNTARVLFFHAVDGADAVDVLFDDIVLTGGISYRGRTVLDIAAGDYDPLIRISEDESLFFDPETMRLESGNFYFIALLGTGDAVALVSTAISNESRVALAQAATSTAEITNTPTPAETEVLDILDTLRADGDFGILIDALSEADSEVIDRLASRLQEPVTFLAPTDTAFENLFATLGLSQTRVFANRAILSDILLYHVVEGEVYAADFRASAGTSIPTLLQPNQAFFVTVDGTGNIFINGRIRFQRVDIQTSNGLIHVLDDVLLPQSALDAFGL